MNITIFYTKTCFAKTNFKNYINIHEEIRKNKKSVL